MENNKHITNVKVLQKSISDKMMHCAHPTKKKSYEVNIKNGKNSSGNKTARLLITVNVLGSSGPIRFLVNEDDSVSAVINAALKLYARDKRLPLLGSDVNHVLLYSANAGLDALHLSESIGSQGVRSFVLCKKEKHPHASESRSEIACRKRLRGRFKAWFNKCLSFVNLKISLCIQLIPCMD